MRVKSNKLYIDYLDHTVSGSINNKDSINRLRFDLLLFSEDILCMSVPACVKLDSTTNILMRLTPFWKEGKIKLILDNKHHNNPWNYFNNRKRILEKNFNEADLIKHFEYTAYMSSHTSYFYNIYINEIVSISKNDFYIDKVFDTDETFRQSVITQVTRNIDLICGNMPLELSIHMGKIFNDLLTISEDRKSLFQRTAIENKLIKEYGATQNEIGIIGNMLDKGFAYANGISCYAAPISLITNRLTGKEFMSILKSVDKELYDIVEKLSWNALYRLSINDTWLDFIDHLNRLLLLYQGSENRKDSLFSPSQIEFSVITNNLIRKLYEYAIETLQQELFKAGAFIIDVSNVKEYSEKLLDIYVYNRNEYWDIIKQVDEFIPALKIVIRSLDRKYKDSTILLRDQGYFINLDKDIS